MDMQGFPEIGRVSEIPFFTRRGDDASYFRVGDTLGFHQVLDGCRAKQLPDGSRGAVFVEQLDELTMKNQADRHD
jgi:hypothetical protein